MIKSSEIYQYKQLPNTIKFLNIKILEAIEENKDSCMMTVHPSNFSFPDEIKKTSEYFLNLGYKIKITEDREFSDFVIELRFQ